MTILETHKLFDFFSDKEQVSHLSHKEKDLLLDRASLWLFDELRRVYGDGIDTHEGMAPFVNKWDFDSENIEEGVLTIPKEEMFIRLSAITVVYDDGDVVKTAPVEIINDDDLPNRLKSQLNKVTVEYPVGTVDGVGRWRLYPKNDISAGYVKFLKRPAKPFFEYTMSGRVVVHDPSKSVDLEWGEGYINQVLFKALTMAGFKLTDNWMADVGMAMNNLKP